MFSETESYVGDLVTGVPVGHLAAGNLGKTSSKLKTDPKACPPWSKLKDAVFWKDGVAYQRLWDLLKGDIQRPKGQINEATVMEGGNVETASFDFQQEGKQVTKVAAWGPLESLLAHRKVHLCWCEVGSDGLPPGLDLVLDKCRDVYLILIGVSDGISRATHQLQELRGRYMFLSQYRSSLLSLHLKEDPPLGAKVPPRINVTREVLLAGPHPLKPHRDWVSLEYPWRPCIIHHLVSLLDIPQKNVFLTMLFLPHPVRPEADVISKMGQIMAQMERWQVSFPMDMSVSALDVGTQLRSVVVAAHAGVDQCEYERLVLSRGLTLNSLSVLPPSEHKHAKKIKKDGDQPTPRKGDSQSSQGADQSPSQASAGMRGERGTGKRFKAPRRVSEGSARGTALEEREGRGKVRLSAEALEAHAERSAEQQAKKARASNTGGTTGKGKKSSQAKGASKDLALDLEDFPHADC